MNKTPLLDAPPEDPETSLGSLPLSISQVEMITGVPKTTLRYWERVFQEFLDPDRTGGNQRSYTMEDVKRILTIKRLLKIEMYTVSGAKRRLGIPQDQEE